MHSPSAFHSPQGVPLLRHLLAFGRDPLGFLTTSVQQYGEVIRLHLEKERETYVVSRPDLIDAVLVQTNRTFAKGYAKDPIMHRVLGNGLVTSEGTFWLRQRRLTQPAFHRQHLMSYATIMGNYTERLLTRWHAEGEEVVIDLHEAMMQLTMEIVARALFDIDLQDSTPEVSHALGLVLKAYTTQMTSAIRHLLARLPLSLVPAVSPQLETAVQQLDGLIYCFIEEHRSAQHERDDLLSTLMAAQGEDGSQMTDHQVRDEVMTLFLAGHETTANLLSWLWYLLSLFPEQEDLLRQEACQVLGERTPTMADLSSLPYTQQAIKETLRLYPPVWWISRETVEDWKLPEGTIPKGAEVGMSQWVMHREPRFFEEPLLWKPERWHNDLEKRLPRQVYFPFGGGPHLCIGNAFAMMEASLIVSTMIQRCHFERGERLPLEPEASLTLRPKHALQVMVQWRKGLCCNTTCVASPFAQRIISPLR